jgi:hypothetical protein
VTAHRYRTGVQTRVVNGVATSRVVVCRSNIDLTDERFVYGEWCTDHEDVKRHATELAAALRATHEGGDYMPNELEPGDLIQLDPVKHTWGPMLCIVDEVKGWGVTCYWLQATEHGKPPGVCHYRAETGTFVRVGKAEWLVQTPGIDDP